MFDDLLMRSVSPMRFLVPLLIAVLVALMPAAAQAKRVALVIANSKYQHISELANPANDATLVGVTLQKAGFEASDITLAFDLDYDAMRRAMLAFKRKADGADVALIYFAGHGFGGGENFLIPIDAQLRSFHELRDETFSQRTLEDAVSLASGLKLVILDACRNDPSRGRMTGLPSTRAVERGLGRVEPENGVLVSYSAKHGTVAQDGPKGGNSPFALALTQHLATPGRDIRFVFGSVRDAVTDATKGQQEPFLYGSLGGQSVYLVMPKDDLQLLNKVPQPPVSEAAQAWGLVKDSEDLLVLEAFRKQYGAHNPLYDALADQRIVLKKLRYEDKSRLLVRSFMGASKSVFRVGFSPNGQLALSGGDDGMLKLWDVGMGKELRTFAGHQSLVTSVAFSPDGRVAVSASHDETVKLWDATTGKQLQTFAIHSSSGTSTFLPNLRIALFSAGSGTFKLLDLGTGKELRTFSDKNYYPVILVALSPDGQYALSGSFDNTVKLWDVGTGKELRIFAGHSAWVNAVAFSPDGRFILSGSEDKTLKLWEVNTGKELHSFVGHSNFVCSVAFSADGRFAISGSWDKTLKLWDVGTGKELRTFVGHSGLVHSVAFSPDGRFALSGSDDKTLKLWDVSEWTALQPAPLAQSTKPTPQDNEPSGTVFKPIIKKD